jgi:hypothetical protein
MKLRRQSGRGIFTLALVAVVLLGGVTRARGQAYRVIHDFRGWPDDGCEIVGVPAVANNGDLSPTSLCYGGGHSASGVASINAMPSRLDNNSALSIGVLTGVCSLLHRPTGPPLGWNFCRTAEQAARQQ